MKPRVLPALALLAAAILLLPLGACKSSSGEESFLTELANQDKETIYHRAEELYSDGKFSEARKLYSFLYDTFPNDPLGHKAALRIADTYYQKKNVASLTEARLRYRDFANRFPNDPDRDYALLMLGNTYITTGLHPDRELTNALEALKAYRQVINLYPDSPYYDDAKARVREVEAILGEHEWLVARYYARNKRWAAVILRLEYLKENYPDYGKMDEVDALLEKANTIRQQRLEEYNRLVEEAKKAAEEDKKTVEEMKKKAAEEKSSTNGKTKND